MIPAGIIGNGIGILIGVVALVLIVMLPQIVVLIVTWLHSPPPGRPSDPDLPWEL